MIEHADNVREAFALIAKAVAVNQQRLKAFPLLLAVAKEAAEGDSTSYLLREELRALDAEHPGWREWAS